MFTINDDMSIYVTRGDAVFFSVTAEENGKPYSFKAGDVVCFKVFGKKDCESVVLEKKFPVLEETATVDMFLAESETRFGEVISKPTDYWYEVELNPDTNPTTIIGYDDDGAKVFKLFPEGGDFEIITPEDIPVVDKELDLTSSRPVQNQAIARKFAIVESNIASHASDKNNPHGVTCSQIGAAPGGYGLGVKSSPPPDNNANSALYSGWFSCYGSTANGPGVDGALFVESSAWGRYFTAKQLSTGCILQRCEKSGVLGEWEWINPPMALGVEYRTAERWQGLPVYCLMVEFGALPNATYKGVTLPVSVSKCIRYSLVNRYSSAILTGHRNITQVDIGGSTLQISTNADMSNQQAFCMMWYTKG